MNISQEDSDHFWIECNRHELIILSNALNNIPQAVDEQEYTTLIGATKLETIRILDAIVAVLGEEVEDD